MPKFLPGQSGNPAGRPRDKYLELFEADMPLVHAVLRRNACQSTNFGASNQAAMYMSDQVIGRPTQRMETQVSGDLTIEHYLAVAAFNGVATLEQATLELDAEPAPSE
jgi:hypothetical protein